MNRTDLETEVEELRRRLAEVEGRFRAFSEIGDEGIAITDGAVIIDANAAMVKLFGYGLDELAGMRLAQLARPAMRPGHRDWGRPSATGSYEIEGVRKDGSTFPLRVRPTRTAIGGRTVQVTLIRDCTDEKQAQAELRAHVRRFEDIAANAQEWIWEVDAVGRYTYVSPAVEPILGYTPKEMLGKHFYDFFAPEIREEITSAALDVFARREPFHEFPNRNVHKDGREVWLVTSGVPILNERGGLVGYRGADTDVTQKRHAERELRRREEELRIAFEESRDAIFWADPETGKLLRCNKGAETLLGRDRAEIVGMHQTEVHPPEKAEHYAGMFQTHFAQNGTVEDEAEVITASGEVRHVLISASVLEVADKPIVQGVMRDITARKRAEEERRKLELRIQQAQKLESLGILAGGIAHDFNNLLMGVLGNAGLALMKLGPNSSVRPLLEQVEKAAQRAAELTNQLLAYSGKGSFVFEPVSLSEVVREMGGLLERILSKNASLHFQCASGLPSVVGDAAQIRQVVMNLITNASDAIGSEQGTITVETGVIDASADYLKSTVALPGHHPVEASYAYVHVADTGCGMDEVTRAQIFDPFFSTKFAGRGLGLAAVLGIVRAHGGAIRVESEVGRGTSVWVLFPPEVEPHRVRVPEPASPDDWRGEGLALVVEDESVVRDTVSKILESCGFQVIDAVDGVEGLELFRRRADEIRVVLLDMTMPRMGGAEALVAMREIRADVPVLLTSGFSERDAVSRVGGVKPAGFVQKPYSPRSLVAVLRSVLG